MRDGFGFWGPVGDGDGVILDGGVEQTHLGDFGNLHVFQLGGGALEEHEASVVFEAGFL